MHLSYASASGSYISSKEGFTIFFLYFVTSVPPFPLLLSYRDKKPLYDFFEMPMNRPVEVREQADSVLTVGYIFVALATTTVFLRLFARYQNGSQVKADDSTSLLGLVFYLAAVGLEFESTSSKNFRA